MLPLKSASSSVAQEILTYNEPGYGRSESSPATVDLNAVTDTNSVSLQACDPSSKPIDQASLDCNRADSTGDDDDNQPAYECRCSVKCSITDVVSGKCPSLKSTSSHFPLLAAKNLSESNRNMLDSHLYMQFCELSMKYASLTSSVRDSLKQQKITAAQLAEKLMDLVGFVPLRQGNECRLLENRSPELKQAETTDEVFLILKEYHSFFNYELVKYIIEKLGTEEDKANLEKYVEDFTEYCKRSVFECPFPSGSKTSPHFVDLVMKVDSESMIKPYTLKAVELFRMQVSKLLQVTKYTLKLCNVEEGCLLLRFQIPRFLKTVVFPLNSEQKKSLKDLGVIKMECDGDSQWLAVAESVMVIIISLLMLMIVMLAIVDLLYSLPYRNQAPQCEKVSCMRGQLLQNVLLILGTHRRDRMNAPTINF